MSRGRQYHAMSAEKPEASDASGEEPVVVPDDLPLDEFDAGIERIAEKLEGRLRHCGRSAFRHLRRAWKIRHIDPEMAAFHLLTAEEEAATAIIVALQRKQYPKSIELNYRNHVHKVSIYPFLLAVREIFVHVNFPELRFSITEGEAPPYARVSFDINEIAKGRFGKSLFGSPEPPLNFVLSDQDGPFNLSMKFSEYAGEKGHPQILRFLRDEANLRNRLLYAADDGIAHAQTSKDLILNRAKRVVGLFLATILIDQENEHQLFVLQCLDALLQVHKRILSSEFTFVEAASESGTGLFINTVGANEPIIELTQRWSIERMYSEL